MARSRIQKLSSLDDGVLRSAARVRARVLALLHGARAVSGLEQTEIADALGIRKSAVNQVLRGNGNIRIDTFGEYLAVMGFEADIALVPIGELDEAEEAGRAPQYVAVTMADQRRLSAGWTLIFGLDSSRSSSHQLVGRRASIAGSQSERSANDTVSVDGRELTRVWA